MGDGPYRFGIATSMLTGRAAASRRPGQTCVTELRTLCDALSAASGLDIQGVETKDYHELLKAMHDGTIHFAWLPPVVAVRAVTIGRAIAIALPVRRGLSTFHTAMFTRPDSKVRDELDVFGATAAWVDKDSAAGYLVIRAALSTRGLGFERAFKKETFLGSHEAVVHAVLTGDVDVGATFVHVDRQDNIVSAGWGNSAVHVVSKYGPIPSDVIAAAANLPGKVVRGVQAPLTDGNAIVRQAAGRLMEAESFTEAESSHLNPLSALLRHIEDTPKRWTSIIPPART